LGLAVVTPAQAGSPEKRAEIVKLLRAMNTGAMINSIMPAYSDTIVQDLRDQGIKVTPGLSEMIAHATTKVMKANTRPFMEKIVGIYDATYSEAEIAELLAFYNSPTGKKTVTAMPEIMQKSQALGMRWGEALTPKIQQELKQAIADRRKKLTR